MTFALLLAQTPIRSMSSSAYITYFLVVLVVSVILGLVSGKLMLESGRSFWLGFPLGFFCGIFGLLVAVALYFTSDRRRPQKVPMQPMDMYGYGSATLPPSPMEMGYQPGLCMQCHAPMPAGSEFCPNCGNYVATPPPQPYAQQPYQQQPYPTQPYADPSQPPYAAPPQQPVPPRGMPPQPGTMKICPLCHSKVPASNPNCSNCGTELGGTSAW